MALPRQGGLEPSPTLPPPSPPVSLPPQQADVTPQRLRKCPAPSAPSTSQPRSLRPLSPAGGKGGVFSGEEGPFGMRSPRSHLSGRPPSGPGGSAACPVWPLPPVILLSQVRHRLHHPRCSQAPPATGPRPPPVPEESPGPRASSWGAPLSRQSRVRDPGEVPGRAGPLRPPRAAPLWGGGAAHLRGPGSPRRKVIFSGAAFSLRRARLLLEGGREDGRETPVHEGAMGPLPRARPDRESNRRPFALRDGTQPPAHTSQGSETSCHASGCPPAPRGLALGPTQPPFSAGQFPQPGSLGRPSG